MRDDFENRDDEREVRGSLARISDALGIPVVAFYGFDADAVEHLQREEEVRVLAVVRAYLRKVDHDAARRFITAVQGLVETGAK
ncbi:hypothetical protein [Methylobacterium mesophilicum]